jgi:hypothetical protein
VQHIIRCRSSESINCGASLEEAWLSRDLNQWLSRYAGCNSHFDDVLAKLRLV